MKKKKKSPFRYIKAVGRAFAALFFNKSTIIQSEAKQKPHQSNEHLSYREVENSTTCTSNWSSATKCSTSYGSSNTPNLHSSHLKISFDEIRKATGNFCLANKIGEGGFGIVYKGKLKDGSFIAIKRAKMDNDDEQLSAEFKNEILTLSHIEHSNLVRFLGYLEHEQEKIIVVEYVSNGTLREHLDGTRGNGLEIAERLDIAVDVATAVNYLHTYANPPIIHRDIKASNVLITETLRAKVADFGFARLAVKDQGATHVYTDVKGTAGYLDPEYLKTYKLTDKSDVYSFGVLLVEMMTGRHPVDEKRSLKEKVTLRWALRKLKDKETVIAMDPRLRRNPASIRAVEQILKLARECVAPSRYSRPSMKKCVEVLWEIRRELRGESPSSHPASSPYNHSTTIVEKNKTKEEGDLYKITDSDYHRFYSA